MSDCWSQNLFNKDEKKIWVSDEIRVQTSTRKQYNNMKKTAHKSNSTGRYWFLHNIYPALCVYWTNIAS